MIHETAHRLERDGFHIVNPIDDPDGTIAYWLKRDGEDFVLVTKEYAYRGLASFMETVVQNAANAGITLIFYENDDESFTVFDADYYAATAKLSRGKSKTRDARWLELDLEAGVGLGDYLLRGKTPMTLAGGNEMLGDYQ